MPEFEGRQSFEGTQFHMHELRQMKSEDFDNKNVLIVGAWVSANDLIVNLLYRKETKDLVKPNKLFVTANNITILENSQDFKDNKDNGFLNVKSGNI